MNKKELTTHALGIAWGIETAYISQNKNVPRKIVHLLVHPDVFAQIFPTKKQTARSKRKK